MEHLWKTERLIIRPYRAKDAEKVWQVLRRPEIYATTYGIPPNYPRARVDWWFSFAANCRKNGTAYEFGIFEKESGGYLGNCGIMGVRRDLSSASIAYFVNPDFWGLGYATEAAEVMLSFAFSFLKLMRVSGSCMAANPASRRVMEKLGFVYEGTGRSELYKDGVFYDVEHLSLLRGEWEEGALSGKAFSG